MKEFYIETFRSKKWGQNTYLVIWPRRRKCILIDAGLNAGSVGEFLEKHELNIVAQLCTHAHFDHVFGAGQLETKYNIETYMSREDEGILKQGPVFSAIFMPGSKISLPQKIAFIGESLNAKTIFDELDIVVLLTPGHTPGSVSYKIGDNIFVGDALVDNDEFHMRLPGFLRKDYDSSKKMLETQGLDHNLYCGHGKPLLKKL